MLMTKKADWTVHPRTRRSNSSDRFETIVKDIARMLRDLRVGESTEMAARGILARLAHVHGLAPKKVSDD
jgi:hypothetical protein